METCKPYPTNVSDEEWAFVAPYLTLMTPDAPQPEHNLREVFNATRWIVRTGAPWRLLPHDFPRWEAVYQQTRCWLKVGSFEAIVHDLRALLRVAQGGSKIHVAAGTLWVTLGHLLALVVTPAYEQERAQVGELAEAVQEVTGEHVELAFVDQGYTGEHTAEAAKTHGIELEVVKLPEAKLGFVLLPCC
jgi:transposase